jgi:lambda family phage portal protein
MKLRDFLFPSKEEPKATWPMPDPKATPRRRTQVQNRYDGASKGRRGQRWRTDNRTPAQEARISLPELVRRSRDLYKNAPWARRGVNLIGIEGIGTGISVKFKTSRGTTNVSKRLQAWLDSPTLDVDGRRNYYSLQLLCANMMVRDGEVLVRRFRKRDPRSGLLCRVQVLSSDWFDLGNDGPLSNGGSIVNGIEYDAAGFRVAYILKRALDQVLWSSVASDPVRVPASDIIHLYRQDEAGQQRGIPWLAPAMWMLRDTAEYHDAQVMKQKLSAALMAKHTTTGTIELPNEVVGETTRPPTLEIEPGGIWRGNQGEDFDFLTPPSVEGFGEVMKLSARQVAVCLPVSYEALTGDLTDTNYSSGRLGWHLFNRSLEQLVWSEVIPHLCDGLLSWGLEAELMPVGALTWQHTPPKREMLDPSKEIPPLVKAVRAGFKSRQEVIRSMGDDPEEVDRQIAEDQARSDALELAFDSDGRRPEGGGVPVAPQDEALDDDNEGTGDPKKRKRKKKVPEDE